MGSTRASPWLYFQLIYSNLIQLTSFCILGILALGRNPDTTKDLKMSMILSWTFLESYWKFDIRDIVWYLHFLLVILSIKNLIKSNNNNLNLTALFYRELHKWMQIRNTVKSMIEHHLSRMTISKKYHNRNDLSNQINVQNISWKYCRY